jgi:hypothetical protein
MLPWFKQNYGKHLPSLKQLTSGNALTGGAIASLTVLSPMEATFKGTTYIRK